VYLAGQGQFFAWPPTDPNLGGVEPALISGEAGQLFLSVLAYERLDVDDARSPQVLGYRHFLPCDVARPHAGRTLFILGEPLPALGRIALIIESLGGQGMGRRDQMRAGVAVEHMGLESSLGVRLKPKRMRM